MVTWHDNWELARQRLKGWWSCESFNLYLTAPKATPWEQVPASRYRDSLEERWYDPGYRDEIMLEQLAPTYFGGENFPIYITDFGPGVLAAFLGSTPGFGDHTVWFHSCIKDPDGHPPLRFDPENRWFKASLALCESGQRLANGRFMVKMPDLIEHVDVLASLRDTQELIYDLTDRPEWVQARLAEIHEAWKEAFDRLYQVIRDEHGGNTCSYRLYGPGRTAKIQCDMAAMLGPDQFAEFAVPWLAKQCDWLDYPCFHLDGVECIRHLDHLLGIKKLKAIQWTPQIVSGKPSPGKPEWFPMYKKILAAGKAVLLQKVEPAEIQPLVDAIGTKGVRVEVKCDSEKEARELLALAEKRWY